MVREPGYGELLGRLDDLEGDLKNLRQIFVMAVIFGFILWMDLRSGKTG